jgi:tetratricopeptide (TPR) repeat protein
MDQGRISAEDGTRLADQAIERAVALEPDLAEVQGMLAWIRIAVDWNVSGADVAFKRAIELGPTSPQVSVKMAEMAAALGHVDVALRLGRQTAEIDPLNWEPFGALGDLYYDADRMEDAAASVERAISIGGGHFRLESLLALVYLAQGRGDSALAAIRREVSPPWQLHAKAIVLYGLGQKSEADEALVQLTAQYAATAAYQIAQVYAYRGQADAAFVWLDRSYAQRDQGISSIKRDRLLSSLRRDPRYFALLRRLRFPTE